jgi:glycopeptide antibiotics resistance protein
MELKNISKWMVIIGALLIWSIKFGIRPYGDWGQPLKFLLGIAPNFIGSFLIPFGACWFFSGRDFLLARIFHIHSSGDLRLVCLMGFGMLAVNEYLQLIPVFGRTFDYFDLIFSAIGLTASYFIYKRLLVKMLYGYYPD